MQQNSSDFLYQVINQQGTVGKQTTFPAYRYPASIELSMLEHGMTIKLNGKKLTKADVKKRAVG